jgi:hypothetical protein
MRADEGKHVRLGTRVNSRAPLVIRWVEHGRPATVEARTIDVSVSGCFAVAPQPIPIGQRLRLTNLVNGNECDAHVVRHGQQTARVGSWESSLKNRQMSFGGWNFRIHSVTSVSLTTADREFLT